MIQIDQCFMIARNAYYSFIVGLFDGRWIGLARSEMPGIGGVFVFAEVFDEPGLLGLADRREAIRMTAAIATDIGHGYGPVIEWFIPKELQASPDDYRCTVCESIGCDGSCQDLAEEMGEDYP